MTCKCKDKKKKWAKPDPMPQERYKTNGQGSVKLGLSLIFKLPVRFPEALHGKDLIIAPNKGNAPNVPNSVVIVGRNGKINKKDRDILVERYPAAFV